jgi:hypothetical protein
VSVSDGCVSVSDGSISVSVPSGGNAARASGLSWASVYLKVGKPPV